jgi:hypothetical protein
MNQLQLITLIVAAFLVVYEPPGFRNMEKRQDDLWGATQHDLVCFNHLAVGDPPWLQHIKKLYWICPNFVVRVGLRLHFQSIASLWMCLRFTTCSYIMAAGQWPADLVMLQKTHTNLHDSFDDSTAADHVDSRRVPGGKW